MANFIQKIFLSKSQVIEINQKEDIIKSVDSQTSIAHNAFMKQNGGVIRLFNVANNKYTLSVQRVFDPSQPEELQIQYKLYVYKPLRKTYITQNKTDKFAKQTYQKVYKIWDKIRQHVK